MNQDLKSAEKTSEQTRDLPVRYAIPSPKDQARCKGCPYPGVGFICWYTDGSCLRTHMDNISRRRR